MSKKRRTTIHVSEDVLDGAKDAGVSNFSDYVEKLVRSDLRGWSQDVALTRKELERVEERLKSVESRWRRVRGVDNEV